MFGNIRRFAEARRVEPGLQLSKQLAKDGLAVLLDWLFPPRCAGCDRVDTSWCPRCDQALAHLPLEHHQRSGTNLDIVSTGVHTGRLQRAIQALKYEQVTVITQTLGRRLSDALAETGWRIDCIVPVPLHANRLATRGYNQAQLLAEQLSAHSALPCLPAAIHRVRDTRSQVGLHQNERRQNMIGAFIADPALLAGKTILVIDDVCTTSATLEACAQAAQRAGARAIYGLTVTTAHSPDAVT